MTIRETSSEITFFPGEGDLSSDPRLTLLAACIVKQQAAGFRNRVDLRQVKCPNCGAPGFNSGWGYWRFVCGGELLTTGDGETSCREGDAS